MPYAAIFKEKVLGGGCSDSMERCQTYHVVDRAHVNCEISYRDEGGEEHRTEPMHLRRAKGCPLF